MAASHKMKSFSKTIENKTRFLSSNRNALYGRLKFLLPEKQAGKNANIFNEEIIALAHILMEYKCLSTKQHSSLLELFSKS